MNTVHVHRRMRGSGRRQGGVYAIEFALVFPVFFFLAYGILAFALVFFTRLNLQFAAEEGARAALQYQTTAGARLLRAVSVATTRSNWMPVPPAVFADLCLLGTSCEPTSTPAAPTTNCGDTMTSACQIVVVASYNYAAHPLIPSVPGLGPLLPSTLRASAAVFVDNRTLNR